MAKRPSEESSSQPSQPKASGAGGGADPQAVQQVASELQSLAQAPATVEGRAVAGFPRFDVGKLSGFITVLLEVAGMGADGKLDPAEAKRIADILFEAINKARSGGG